jgi:hypothetical protein
LPIAYPNQEVNFTRLLNSDVEYKPIAWFYPAQ